MKQWIDLLMRVVSFPFFLFYLLQRVFFGPRKAFSAMMQTVSLFPGVTGEWFRRGVLKWITFNRLTDCCISFGTTFSDPRVSIGNGVYIGTRCDIGFAHIGQDCIIGSGVHIISGQKQHFFEATDVPIRDQGGMFAKVTIGENSWIGNGALISADVGKGCVIGTGSVVVSSIKDFAVAAGNPARVIRTRK
ncbi:MAG: acyltransferase [Desulfobacter sp.]|nr:MAG: acyltransferase [Desulfobacter sp.]